jgi:hypothetical protein
MHPALNGGEFFRLRDQTSRHDSAAGFSEFVVTR